MKALAIFPKPLIAGVNGSNLNLGVTQLLLFDIVIASDKSVYETHYTKYGQLPEGFFIWNSSLKINQGFVSIQIHFVYCLSFNFYQN